MTRKKGQMDPPKAPSLSDLTKAMSAAQVYVCQLVAEYVKPAEILVLCRDYIARGTIRESWVRHVTSPVNRPAKYERVVQCFRNLLWERRGDIPICDPTDRAKARQRIVERNEGQNDNLVRLTLLDAEKVYGQSGEERPVAAVQVNVGQFAGLQAAGDAEVIEVVPGIALPTQTDEDCGSTANSPPSGDEATGTGQEAE